MMLRSCITRGLVFLSAPVVPVCIGFFPYIYADSPEAGQVWFQDPASPAMASIVSLHHDILYYLLIVLGLVFWLLFKVLTTFTAKLHGKVDTIKVLNHGAVLEIIWTVVPAILLVFVAIPSFSVLYTLDELSDPVLTLKVVGHQWYWSYEYSDHASLETQSSSFVYDSYMLLDEDLEVGQFRLLEVDKRVVSPAYTQIRAIVTSTDVLHSWAIPSLGIKMDACPGRLNQVSTFIARPGVYYGQCSEICGINHGFMPIVVEAVDFERYASWVFAKYSEDSLI